MENILLKRYEYIFMSTAPSVKCIAHKLYQLWIWKSSVSPLVSRLNILVLPRLNRKTDMMGRLCNEGCLVLRRSSEMH